MAPTRPLMLAAVAAVAAVLGLAAADLFSTLAGRSVPVPWSSSITVCALGLALLMWTIVFRRRLRDPDRRVNPFVAVRSAALAMAASRAGAIIAGLYVGFGVWFASDLITDLAKERAIICLIGAVGSIVLIVAALWLERVCRLPEDGDDEESTPAGEARRYG